MQFDRLDEFLRLMPTVSCVSLEYSIQMLWSCAGSGFVVFGSVFGARLPITITIKISRPVFLVLLGLIKKQTPVFGSSIPVLVIKMKQGKSVHYFGYFQSTQNS